MKGRSNQSVSLEELAAGKLPQRVLKAISEMEVTLDEVAEWEAGKPKFLVGVKDREVQVRINLNISLKKVIAVFTGVGGGIGIIVTLVGKWLPVLQSFFNAP